nr:hypothetical protein [Haloechinothrix alba]
MVKLFGRGNKSRPLDPQRAFATAPIPRQAGPPASSTPVADYLQRGWPGVSEGYVVLPRSLVEEMPLPWQQQMTNLLAQFHQTYRQLSWPEYRVLPSRRERLVDLDEEQLAEAGYLVEIDGSGELVYRERSGRVVDDPESTTVPVTCLDPVIAHKPAPASEPAPRRGGPAPMNVGPEPVWQPDSGHRPAAQPPQDQAAQLPQDQAARPASERYPFSPGATPGNQLGEGQGTWQAGEWFTDSSSDFGPTGEPIERPYRFRD